MITTHIDDECPPSGNLSHMLAANWKELADSASMRDTIQQWRRRQHHLRSCVSGTDVLAAVQYHLEPEARDEVLVFLLRSMQNTTDNCAEQLLLQAYMPRVISMVDRTGGDPEVRNQNMGMAVAALWETLHTYPIANRPRRVPANIAMDSWHRYRSALDADDGYTPARHESTCWAGDISEYERELHTPASDRAEATLHTLELIAWARRTAVVTAHEVELLVEISCPESLHSSHADVARRHGLSVTACRKRYSRAVAKVSAAVRKHLDSGVSLEELLEFVALEKG